MKNETFWKYGLLKACGIIKLWFSVYNIFKFIIDYGQMINITVFVANSKIKCSVYEKRTQTDALIPL